MCIKEERKINLDLLRILSMIMIIILHFMGHGGCLNQPGTNSILEVFLWWIEGIAYASVDVYVLLCGYFMINRKFNIKKLIYLVLEVWFYSVVIYFIMYGCGIIKTINISEFIQVIFPITRSSYWFVSTYIVMYCLAPFLNIGLKKMSKKNMQYLNICNILFFCIWDKGSGPIWFIVLYIVAAYIRLYYQKGGIVKYKLVLGYLFLSIMLPLSKSFISFLTIHLLGAEYKAEYFYKNDSIIVLGMAVILLLIFIEISINNILLKKLVLSVSPLCFGVYLIHDNNSIRNVLWEIMKPASFLQSRYFIVYMIFVIMTVFITCIGIEKMRSELFIALKIDKICLLIENRILKVSVKSSTYRR